MYEKLTDERLAELFVSGDEQAFEALYSRYERTIKSVSRLMYLSGGSSEDLWQEGFMGLYYAAKSYDGDKENSSSFRTFAISCIKNRMINAVVKENSDKRKAMSNTVSIETELEEKIISPEDFIIGEETRNEIKAKVVSGLSPFEREVFELYVDGYKYDEIAERLDKSPKSVDNAIQRIKLKCKEYSV